MDGPPGTNGIAESKAFKVQEQLYRLQNGTLIIREFYNDGKLEDHSWSKENVKRMYHLKLKTNL